MQSGYIDLHSHWVAGIDDGAKSESEARSLLSALGAAGFGYVVATPHMRPGMFENTREGLIEAYRRTSEALGTSESAGAAGFPRVGLSSEHYFDDVVFERLMGGEGLPYPGGHAALVEFNYRGFPAQLQNRLFDLQRKGLRPVIAHPERYEPVQENMEVLEPLLDVGAVLLLDVAALVGKYGRASQRCAEELLDGGYYYAACSDAHRERDVEDVVRGIEALGKRLGQEEALFLLSEGPLHILEGTVES